MKKKKNSKKLKRCLNLTTPLLCNMPLLFSALLLLLIGKFFSRFCIYIGISLLIAFLLGSLFQFVFERTSLSRAFDDHALQNSGEPNMHSSDEEQK